MNELLNDLVSVAFPTINFLSAFWSWVYLRRWTKARESLDLTNGILMVSMLMVLSLSFVSRITPPDYFSDLRMYLRLSFLLVAVAWAVHTGVFVFKMYTRK